MRNVFYIKFHIGKKRDTFLYLQPYLGFWHEINPVSDR
jgi:hypothetical protein